MFIQIFGEKNMKAMKYFAIIGLSIIVILTLITLFLPTSINVEKSVDINVSVGSAYTMVNDLKNLEMLFPILRIDKKMKKTFSPNTIGKGAFIEWQSEMKNVGGGKITIVESRPDEYIKFTMTLDGVDGGYSEIKFYNIEGKTRVSWAMLSEVSFVARWFVPTYEEMFNKDLESTLASLKKTLESNPEAGSGIKVTQFGKTYYIAVSDSSGMNPGIIQGKYASAYKEIMGFMMKNKLQMSGPPVSITNSFSKTFFSFNAAIPFKQPFIGKVEGRVIIDSIPDCKVVMAVHIGPYSTLMNAYNLVMKYISDNKLKISGRSWEEYVDDPTTTKPEKLRTNIYFPVK
jgi:effector-binding domain-containing protein